MLKNYPFRAGKTKVGGSFIFGIKYFQTVTFLAQNFLDKYMSTVLSF